MNWHAATRRTASRYAHNGAAAAIGPTHLHPGSRQGDAPVKLTAGWARSLTQPRGQPLPAFRRELASVASNCCSSGFRSPARSSVARRSAPQ